MSGVSGVVAKAVTGVAQQAVESACACGARAWSLAVERTLARAAVRLEVRSR